VVAGRVGLRFFARSSVEPGEEVAVLGVAVAAGAGLIRGGIERRGTSRGVGVRAASLVSGASVGVGNIRGGKEGRFAGVKVGNGFADGSVGADAFGTGVGLIRTGIDGEGRVLTGGENDLAGVAVAANALADASGEDAGDVKGEDAAVGVSCGRALGDGRVRGEADMDGVTLAAAVAVATGVELGACAVGDGRIRTEGEAVEAGVGLAL
jgi:hypothetical protein